MNKEQFHRLSSDLRSIAPNIPLNWNRIQNNMWDGELCSVCNIFDIMTLGDLERYIAGFDEEHQIYYKRRWYLLRCADCDEYLFYVNDNVVHNPNRYDKAWDINIGNNIAFDIKGTVIPRRFRSQYDDIVMNSGKIVQFYYDNQSKGMRFDMQNRLFIVHHSLVDETRELLLRCAWDLKESVYRKFVENVENIEFINYKGCTASVIFILETECDVLKYKIVGLDRELQSL